MPAAKDRVRYFNTGPWPYYIGFTTSPDAFAREMKRLKIDGAHRFVKGEHSNATTHFLTNHSTGCAIICIEKPSRRRTREQYAALIAHEAMHIIQDMRDSLGDLGSEAEAYLIQQIVQESLQIAWATGKSTRKAPVS